MKIVDIQLHRDKDAMKPHRAIVTVLVDGERRSAEDTATSAEAAIRRALHQIANNLAEDLVNTVTVVQSAIYR